MKKCIIIDCECNGVAQPLTNFHNNGYGKKRPECKACRKRIRAIDYKINRDKILMKVKTHRNKNKEKYKKYQKSYQPKYYIQNKERAYVNSRNRIINGKTAAYHRKRYAQDINFRLAALGRSRRGKALKSQSSNSNIRYIESLGCSMSFFMKYIESKFLPGMTWANHGKGEGKWQIDEIRPCASFDLSDTEQYKVCFHYTNAQPLWARDNVRKNSIYEGIRYVNKKAA